MNTDRPSRRRLLGGFLAGLTAWLWPPPPRAAPRRPAPAAVLGPTEYTCVTTSTYDARDALTGLTPGAVTTFTYYAGAEHPRRLPP